MSRLSPERWREAEPLLDHALSLDPDSRAPWVDALEGTHPGIAPLVRELLAAHDRAEQARDMETVPKLAPPPRASPFAEGQRVGPFRLARLLGRGGMGEVWLAAQADGRVERDVALKLPMVGGNEALRERFDQERDILARLDHPNIAGLFDAGVTDSGQPYLAMEVVDGESILEHAKRQGLSVSRRIALFREVLAATGHAHRHLVVHRDLKPANILVDRQGRVKLLDFGIAKLIAAEGHAAADAAGLTRAGHRVMTLRYAAPEQVDGGAITTATDTYSLGVVLHELLASASPYRAVREGRPVTEHGLMQEEPSLPSSLAGARALRGDLDAILLKALRRDPAQRYLTVDAFDDDLARHLADRPVLARRGTVRYLASRFIRRHRWPIASAAAVLATLGTGLVIAENERRAAVAERSRAERHFQSVRSLANTFVFQVHDEIENLPGSLKARQLLVGTALKYLDGLATESVDDRALAVEVAAAYRKIAEIKGDVYHSSLGQTASARAIVDKALKLLEALEARHPGQVDVMRERRALGMVHSRILKDAGDAKAVAESEATARLAEKVAAMPGAGREDLRHAAQALAEQAITLAVMKSDYRGAVDPIVRAAARMEALATANPDDAAARVSLAGTYERASVIHEFARVDATETDTLAWMQKSVAYMQKAITITEGLAKDQPNNLTHSAGLVKRHANLADTLAKMGRLEEAGASIGRAVILATSLAVAEPDNAVHATSRLRVLSVASNVLYNRKDYAAAVARGREGRAAFVALGPQAKAGLAVRANHAGVSAFLGASLLEQALAAPPSLPRERRAAQLKEACALLT